MKFQKIVFLKLFLCVCFLSTIRGDTQGTDSVVLGGTQTFDSNKRLPQPSSEIRIHPEQSISSFSSTSNDGTSRGDRGDGDRIQLLTPATFPSSSETHYSDGENHTKKAIQDNATENKEKVQYYHNDHEDDHAATTAITQSEIQVNSEKPEPREVNIIIEEIQNVKEKAIGNLMKIFGFGLPDSGGLGLRDISPGPPPEFMIDLYNTITDSYGVTRAKNPYDAHVVRSFIERDNSLNDFFFFNISGMEETEKVLEAELHIHRLQTPHEKLHPSLYLTPFYILSLYQVLDPKSLAIPDLHKLLGVHYVPALGSGWEVFNVKQAVMEWVKGERPNYGFLVAATSLGGDRVPVRFSRRGETLHSKQPILVLFNEDSKLHVYQTSKPIRKTLKGTVSNGSTALNDTDYETTLPTSSLENPRFHHALLYKDSIRHPNSVSRFRSRRSKNQTETTIPLNRNFTECGRHDLFVSFEAIGWSSWIISPKGYNAFYCDGPCSFPLGQQVKPTNHATVQSIVHELNLSPGIKRPCCVPTTLLPISLLYYDDNDNVVLKQYVDMVAESCGCH